MSRQIPNIQIRGIRGKGIPTGYLIGRTAKGSGPPHLISPTQLRLLGVGGVNAAGATGSTAHGFGFFVQGLMGDGETLGHATFPQDVTFVNGDPRTLVSARVAALADTSFLVQDITGVPVTLCVIHFAPGAFVATVTWTPSPAVILSGHPFQLLGPATHDTNLADISGTITGNG